MIENPDEAPTTRDRLLLISYEFPPSSSAGALRWQKLALHARRYGWGLDVLTLYPENASAASLRCAADKLPAGIRVFGIPRVKYAIERLENTIWPLIARMWRRLEGEKRHRLDHNTDWKWQQAISLNREEFRRFHRTAREPIRAYYALLDYARYRAWASSAGRLALKLVESDSHRGVITCGPPHMVHEAGRRISRRVGIPLAMDMRDPWSLVERLPERLASPLWLHLARRYERRAVAASTLIVCNTEPAQAALQKEYPDARDRCIAVYNGYDDDSPPKRRKTKRFVIAYAGTVYLDRNPRNLFKAAARLVQRYNLNPDHCSIEFMGHVAPQAEYAFNMAAAQDGISDYVRIHPPGSRKEARQFLAGAAVLVSLPQDSHLAVPSKIFEYMTYSAWVLVLADRGSATEEILRDSGAIVTAPDDVGGITRVLCELYSSYVAGTQPEPIACAKRFSRARQADHLFHALNPWLNSSALQIPKVTSRIDMHID